ncbi:MAG TPA: YggT family protein [Blastocatellia bacterium]|jgi:uncharacterized protein YggT (Ycf19 family)
MLEDEKLAVDESRKIAQHEAIKDEMRNEVREEVVSQARPLTPGERANAEALGDQLKAKAVDEVAETEAEIGRARATARISQVVDYIFYFIYGIIGLMFLLDLVGARRSNDFYQFVNAVASPFLAPFRGLVEDPGSANVRFRLSYLIALVVYLLLHLAVNGLLRLIAHRRTAV